MANIFDLLKIVRGRPSGLAESIRFEGLLRVRRLPEDWTPEQYRYWWLPEVDDKGHLLHPARISEREKARYTEVESHNQLMVAGRTELLTFVGASGGSTTPFGKYLAIGTGVLQATSPTDTQLVNEVYRVLQSAFTVQGSQVDLNFQIPAASAQVVMTEAGLFGGSASGTANSGTLCTHVLFSYTKGNYSISCDYLITLI